jgi:NAD(P)-dependent dehydrogenase (short-subunit alcohol dehydrogenase family)
MDLQLTGKKALIAGGSKGIGRRRPEAIGGGRKVVLQAGRLFGRALQAELAQ